MGMKTAIVLAGIAALAATSSGCARRIGGGDLPVLYISGQVDAIAAAPIDEVYRATLDAMREAEFVITSAERAGRTRKLVGYSKWDKHLEVRLSETPEGITKIRIRVDSFGDKELSQAILDRIRSRLKGTVSGAPGSGPRPAGP